MKIWFQHKGLTVPSVSRITSGQTVYSSASKSTFSRRAIIPIIILFCSLEILDALITHWAVNNGLVWEGNHLIAQMAGSWNFILIKFAGAVVSGLAVQKLHEHFPKVSMAAATSIAVYYGVVLIWNANMIINILLSK